MDTYADIRENRPLRASKKMHIGMQTDGNPVPQGFSRGGLSHVSRIGTRFVRSGVSVAQKSLPFLC